MSTIEMTTANLRKKHVEIAKMMSETSKLYRESACYSIVTASGLISSIAAITTVISN